MHVKKKEKLFGDMYVLQIHAPEIAKKAQAGHFVLLQLHEHSARLPIPISDADKTSITLIFQAKCKQTQDLSSVKKNQKIHFLLGPLGKAREKKEISNIGKVVLVGEGAGIGQVYFYAKALKEAGNKVISLLGGVPKKNIFWENKIQKVSDKTFVIDPKSDFECSLTHAVEGVLRKIRVDEVITFGSAELMQRIANRTKLRSKNRAYLSATMIDGIGMCGSCRIHVDGSQKLCCIDGPEFNAHQVDWPMYIHKSKEYHQENQVLCKKN